VADLDVAVLRGANRAATVLMAARVRGLILDDASRPHGIRFSSRHATGDCWAFWLRHVDAGSTAASEPLQPDDGSPLIADDVDLRTVADRFAIRLW
jgi:hypothetical protein